eukprot:5295712-Prymnesium_polylepis.2
MWVSCCVGRVLAPAASGGAKRCQPPCCAYTRLRDIGVCRLSGAKRALMITTRNNQYQSSVCSVGASSTSGRLALGVKARKALGRVGAVKHRTEVWCGCLRIERAQAAPESPHAPAPTRHTPHDTCVLRVKRRLIPDRSDTHAAALPRPHTARCTTAHSASGPLAKHWRLPPHVARAQSADSTESAMPKAVSCEMVEIRTG